MDDAPATRRGVEEALSWADPWAGGPLYRTRSAGSSAPHPQSSSLPAWALHGPSQRNRRRGDSRNGRLVASAVFWRMGLVGMFAWALPGAGAFHERQAVTRSALADPRFGESCSRDERRELGGMRGGGVGNEMVATVPFEGLLMAFGGYDGQPLLEALHNAFGDDARGFHPPWSRVEGKF